MKMNGQIFCQPSGMFTRRQGFRNCQVPFGLFLSGSLHKSKGCNIQQLMSSRVCMISTATPLQPMIAISTALICILPWEAFKIELKHVCKKLSALRLRDRLASAGRRWTGIGSAGMRPPRISLTSLSASAPEVLCQDPVHVA